MKEQGVFAKGFFHEYAFEQTTKGFRWIAESCKRVLDYANDILKKLALIGYDLDEYSLDTVKMFYNDAVKAGFKL